MIEDKHKQNTQIHTLGEFGLIDYLCKDMNANQKSTIKGIGDDAALLNFTDGKVVVSTDMLVEGVHFDLSYMPLKHLGYKAVVVNLSDIYAMNAKASQITVSIAASNRFTVEDLKELYAGIKLASNIYGIDVVGGDSTSSNKGLIISITAIGSIVEEKICYRSGAQNNDLLVVSGDLGAAYLGLQVLEREKAVFEVNPNNQPDLNHYTYLVERQLKPEARKDIIELLQQLKVKPTAMIDISDGLSSEILHITKSSKVGCYLFEEKIPLDPTVIATCEEFNIDSTMVALSGGEDYELLFTINLKDYDKIKGNPNITVIGHIADQKEGCHLITRANEKIPITAQGWDSFAK